MSTGKVFSLNDDTIDSPKLRRDQLRKCQRIVRDNAQFPIVALGLVRDFIKHSPNIEYILLREEESRIVIGLKSQLSKMECEYSFSLIGYPPIETPTL